jgi:hypothetical protein
LFAAFGIALALSELQIGLKATGRYINGSISQVPYSIFQFVCSIIFNQLSQRGKKQVCGSEVAVVGRA